MGDYSMVRLKKQFRKDGEASDGERFFQRLLAPPPIYVECVVCERPEQQVEWARRPEPLVCLGCGYRNRREVRSLRFGDCTRADYDFLVSAWGVLRAIEREVGRAV